MPKQILESYGKRQAGILFLLALFGILSWGRKKAYPLLQVLGLWPLHPGIYFLTFFRPGYLGMIFFVIFIFAAQGLIYLTRQGQNNRERVFWSAIFLTGSLATAWMNKWAITVGLSIFLIGWWFAWLIDQAIARPGNLPRLGSLAILVVSKFWRLPHLFCPLRSSINSYRQTTPRKN